MSEFRAEIRKVWATQLHDKRDEIRRLNINGYRNIYSQGRGPDSVTLTRLGGLRVSFVDLGKDLVEQDIPDLVASRRAVDLSFGATAIRTTLPGLLEASLELYGFDSPLSRQLLIRLNNPNVTQPEEEMWFMPKKDVIPYK